MTAKARKAVCGVLTILVLALYACRAAEESPAEKLKALATHSGRPIDARLTGFDWPAARLQRATHASLLDPARLELAGAASTVIQSQLNDPSARARHESGAAYLLIDRDRDAIDALESAVRQSPNNAAYWSDLGAARYTLAVTEKRPHELPQALADTDHALRLDPKLNDALFNRALIIEALGISEAARRAWQRYAAADPSSHWSAEAMRHLGDLRVVTTRDEFQNRLATASRALPDTAPLVALARNYPQEARTWSEGPLLAKWADAFHKGDAKTATETLTIVRTLGTALTEFNHVQSVADIVATIDHANPADTRTLADAHAIYRDGRILYSQRRIADAQKKLQEARALFARTRSPMTLITDYYLANCLYDSNRVAESARALDEVAARVDPKRYPGLTAEIKWERTLAYSSAGDWEAAIRTATKSRNIFDSLGEIENRGEMDMLLATHLDLISQPAAAWTARVAAIKVLGRAGSINRIRTSLTTSIQAQVEEGNFEAALSLAAIAVDDLRHGRQPTAMCVAESSRAQALAKLGYMDAAVRSIDSARQMAQTIPDPAFQRRTLADMDVAEAAVRRSTPSTSLRLLDSAIAFYRSSGVTAWLPKAYLERGRTLVAAKNDVGALADFDTALREIDLERSSITDRDLRSMFYDAERGLASEKTALLLRHGETARAFEFCDATRARSVYEHLDNRPRTEAFHAAAERLPPRPQEGTALLEYALLEDSVLIFYAAPSHTGVVRASASPAILRTAIERCNDLLRRRSPIQTVQQQLAVLYQILIKPVAAQIAGADRLIVVPDRQIHEVPFAALYDVVRHHYIVDDYTVSLAPRATLITRSVPHHALTPALVVSDPHGGDESALPNAMQEANAVAAMYDPATLLMAERATRARFIAAAQHSGMIHYAGHADSSSTDPFGSLHLAPDGYGRTGDLDANEIASLNLSRAELVILAACGTMRGELQHVEGMPSIARAFLAAGARNVIGTLWEVDDDAVVPLFQRIHSELHNGFDPAAALRIAQAALAHDQNVRLSHPSTWAPVEILAYVDEQQPGGLVRSK
ncbi:MAG: CHAT domain-containing protein [Acidobacteria bacterium]|nr:CHAT domain-containing protein [Acidobacteriota bacterium]MBV9070682.1 CHAT domain-containing protein [Acidobacteriota bacterium]MBV9186885.1 CHAT domain-containing protein [Acidobacteriota bacterium]